MRNIKNVTRDIRLFTEQLDHEIACLNRPVTALSTGSFSTISTAYISEEGLISWVKEKLKAIGRRAVILVNSVIAKFSRNKETLEKNIAIYKANPKANVKLAISPKTMKKALVFLSVAAAAATAIVVGVKLRDNAKRKEVDRRIDEIAAEGHRAIDQLDKELNGEGYTYSTNQAIGMSQQAIQQQAAISNSFNQIKAELNKGAEATEEAIRARNKAMAEANKLADVASSVGHKVSASPKDVIDEVMSSGAGSTDIKAYKTKVLMELSKPNEKVFTDAVNALQKIDPNGDAQQEVMRIIQSVSDEATAPYMDKMSSLGKQLHDASDKATVDRIKNEMKPLGDSVAKVLHKAVNDYINTKIQAEVTKKENLVKGRVSQIQQYIDSLHPGSSFTKIPKRAKDLEGAKALQENAQAALNALIAKRKTELEKELSTARTSSVKAANEAHDRAAAITHHFHEEEIYNIHDKFMEGINSLLKTAGRAEYNVG